MQQDTQEALAEDSESYGYSETAWREANVICGGFPCQDISNAGRRAGITGERSSYWAWLCGTIRLVRPLYAIVENVAALLGNGMDTVIGDLAEVGYDTEWDCIPASAVGAPHRRDRVWIVAYRNGHGESVEPIHAGKICETNLADPDGSRFQKQYGIGDGGPQTRGIFTRSELERVCATRGKEQWEVEPSVGRVVDGVPERVDRISALGNSLVPQIPELIGQAILNYENWK